MATNKYGSTYTGAEVDAAVAGVAELRILLNTLQTLVNSKYTKPTSGIPSTDLTTSVQDSITLANGVPALSDKVTQLQKALDDIQKIIPTEASASNQLADRSFVNSTVQNMAARFIGAAANGGAFANEAALISGPWYHAGSVITELTDHDYATVLVEENDVSQQYRYGYEQGTWAKQYKVGSAFTSDQTLALNSGITEEGVAKIGENAVNITAANAAINALAGRIAALETLLTNANCEVMFVQKQSQ